MTLPDCPHVGCDAAGTLTAEWVPRYLRFRAFCSCCSKVTWLSKDGEPIVSPEPMAPTHDGNGNYLPRDP